MAFSLILSNAFAANGLRKGETLAKKVPRNHFIKTQIAVVLTPDQRKQAKANPQPNFIKAPAVGLVLPARQNSVTISEFNPARRVNQQEGATPKVNERNLASTEAADSKSKSSPVASSAISLAKIPSSSHAPKQLATPSAEQATVMNEKPQAQVDAVAAQPVQNQNSAATQIEPKKSKWDFFWKFIARIKALFVNDTSTVKAIVKTQEQKKLQRQISSDSRHEDLKK